MSRYTDREMMAISAGRLIRNGDILFARTGVAMLAATVAKRIHAPKSVVFFETGGIDPSLDELPMAVADSRVMSGTSHEFWIDRGLLDCRSPQAPPHCFLRGSPDRQIWKSQFNLYW